MLIGIDCRTRRDENGELWVKTGSVSHDIYIGDLEDTDGEHFANARLIAAAPELLEALEGILNIFDRNLSESTFVRRYRDTAIAAIKKARGEE